MMLADKHRSTLLALIIFIVAGILSFHQIICDDHWWHVATGRLILENGAVPTVDPFSFTYYGAPWKNNEWGFSLFLALLWDHMGETGFYLYRWLLLFGIVYFSYRAVVARVAREHIAPLPPVFIACLLALLFLVMDYRSNIRPHMLEYFFLAFSVFVLQRPPAQLFRCIAILAFILFALVWAFFHPSWIILPTLLVITWLDDLINRSREIRHTSTMFVDAHRRRLFLLLATLLASILFLIVKNAGFFAFYRSHLLEMQSIFEWRPYWYWLRTNPFFAVTLFYYLIFILTFPLFFKRVPVYALFVLAFTGLSLLIIRFNAEFTLLSIPFVVTETLRIVMSRYSTSQSFLQPRMRLMLWGLCVVLWIAPLGHSLHLGRTWGIGVSKADNPVLVADFMERMGLEGNLVAGATVAHSYISFRLWPKIKIFIDGRNTTVFPASFIHAYGTEPIEVKIQHYPTIDYWLPKIETAMLFRDREKLIRNSPSSIGYELIYFNDNTALYMKAELLDRYPQVKPFRMLFPGSLVDEDLMWAVVDAGTMPELRRELAYYGSIAVDPSEKRLYELMQAEIAKYGPVD